MKTALANFAAPRVVAGDFNAHPDDSEIIGPTGMTTDYIDLWPVAVNARTAAPADIQAYTHKSSWRPDYIFRSKDSPDTMISLLSMRIERPTNPQNGNDVSDHFPVVAVLTVQ